METRVATDTTPDQEEAIEFADPCHSPLLIQLHQTQGARLGLKELRRRLSTISGTLAQAVREERHERA